MNIIPFEGIDQGFRHTVALRAIDRRKAGFEIDFPCEDDRFHGCVCRSVVRHHLDCLRRLRKVRNGFSIKLNVSQLRRVDTAIRATTSLADPIFTL